jgi:glyoxylase-like metal-dependent hydrolase (beta-lactamase superfamily II)
MTDIRVHHLSCPTMCPASKRLVNRQGSLFERGRMVCHCWLIEAPGGLVLVDTGLGTADLADPRGRLGLWFGAIVHPERDPQGTAISQIRALGHDPRDVRDIVVTHLDLDHAGGLPDFPWARVHLHQAELHAAQARATFQERNRYRPVHFAHGPHWHPHEDTGETWFGFQRTRALHADAQILLIPLFGHTRGHCGVATQTRDGWLLHAGDAYFSHEELHPTPTCPPGLRTFQRLAAIDNEARLANQARLHALAQTHSSEIRIHSAHCPVEFDRLARAAAPG